MTIMDKDDSILDSKKKVNKKKAVKKHTLFYKILSFILIIITLVMLGLLIINDIFSIGYLIPIVLIVLLIIFVNSFILNKNHLRKWVKNIFSIFSILIIILDLLMIFFGTSTLRFLSNITDTGYRVESFGVYVLKTSDYDNIKDLNKKSIKYLDHEDDTAIREAIAKIRKKVNIDVDYDANIENLLNSLINKDVDAILVDISYDELIMEDFNNIYKNMKLIDTIDIVSNIDTLESDADITKDPFVIYLSGIDTKGNVQSKARSDVNLLLAVNPETKNILMINTPRDYYVTLNSKKKKDKLTHAGIYGVEESLHTLEDLYDTNIDYYARINFTSFVSIVDAIDGIKVNVPKSFCEQNSNRSFAKKDLICLNKGYQTLNGEQALALARHRKTLATGDVARGENQMMVLQAIINKALSPKILSKYDRLISALEGKVSTNMTTNEMIRFATKQKNKNNDWKFSSLSAKGRNSSAVCFSTGSSKSYVMEPDVESLNIIRKSLDNLFEGKDEIVATTAAIKE